MRRDNFQLREHGAMMAQSAVFLDGDIQPEHQPSVEAKIVLNGLLEVWGYMLLGVLKNNRIGLGGFVNGLMDAI
jgi:hypothetical protein